jgi:hypothetical protein
MTDLFKTLSGGLAKFVLGWIVPSAVAVGAFILVCGPALLDHWKQLQGQTPRGLAGGAAYGLAVIALAMSFAYASLPVYRLLEGYTLPEALARPLLRWQLKEWHRLQALSRKPIAHTQRTLALERLQDYPARREWVLPTRLGNAFKALETYGTERFKLDSQTLWYEISAVIPAELRKDVEDGRSSVDFFISALAHALLLGVLALSVALVTRKPGPLVLAIFALATVRPAYLAAVRNMADYRFSVQAAVNVGRKPLAFALGLTMPSTLQEELHMWATLGAYVSTKGESIDLARLMNPHRGKQPPL